MGRGTMREGYGDAAVCGMAAGGMCGGRDAPGPASRRSRPLVLAANGRSM